ncbi:hypothetical protein OAL30_01495 [Akkermansiaceae bacterium]|nr:hypothetical protein [Akkermansiaceae bacterium]
MKKLSLALSLAFGATALADVPALINYQGRLVDGVGNPIVGKKEFKLDIYDSQTEGTLIYQETLPDITLDEDGAYSFQFGAGESRSETSVLVATGDGEAAFFQKVFEETPVGVISVTDGTNTFKTGDAPTGEEPFSFTYTTSLKRLNLVCNEPPAEGTKFTATFRYAESGIVGALGSAAEHWMEVTIGGEKQEPRQRLVAVPFALRAGEAASLQGGDFLHNTVLSNNIAVAANYSFAGIPDTVRAIDKIELWHSSLLLRGATNSRDRDEAVIVTIRRMDKNNPNFISYPGGFTTENLFEYVYSSPMIIHTSEEVVYTARDFGASGGKDNLIRIQGLESIEFDHTRYVYALALVRRGGSGNNSTFFPTVAQFRLFYKK